MEAFKSMTDSNCLNNLKWNHDFFFFLKRYSKLFQAVVKTQTK